MLRRVPNFPHYGGGGIAADPYIVCTGDDYRSALIHNPLSLTLSQREKGIDQDNEEQDNEEQDQSIRPLAAVLGNVRYWRFGSRPRW